LPSYVLRWLASAHPPCDEQDTVLSTLFGYDLAPQRVQPRRSK
jgi:hypothetical protein